jgi:hypothetical protein
VDPRSIPLEEDGGRHTVQVTLGEARPEKLSVAS